MVDDIQVNKLILRELQLINNNLVIIADELNKIAKSVY